VAFTTDELLRRVRLLAFLPDAGGPTDAELLEVADDELRTLVAARLAAAREEHWVKTEDVPIVAGTTRYRLLRRALGRIVRSIRLVEQSTQRVIDLHETDAAITGSYGGVFWSAGTNVYYWEDDYLVFPIQPPTGWSIRIRYLRRPSRLVLTNACAPIQYPTSTTVLHVGSVPTAFVAGYLVDVVRGDAPFDLPYVDRVVSGTTSSTITLDPSTPIATTDFVDLSTRPNDRADYACPRDCTCYPQLPEELHPVLVAAVARRALEAVRDKEGAELTRATLAERAKAASDIIEPRNEERSEPLVSRHSAMRGGSGGPGRRRWWPS